MEDFIGKEIGGCKVEKKLGQGGMGAVYQGTQLSLGREVAIKVISEAYMTNEQAVARFEREARSVAQLSHPNIVQVYDLGRTPEGQYYIIMEFVDGRSMSDFLKTKGAFQERECLTMVRQAAKGLQAAAEKKIIHRDIKPDNLMITVKGVVKVADFGLAKDTGSASQLTATGHVMGTPAYIAPEQGDGRVADHRSDIYSLGATLYAMLTGEMPYTGETPIAIVLQHIQAPVPDPKAKKPELSDDTAKIVKKMMAKEPEGRYQSCAELIHDIDVVLGVAKDGERLIADGGDASFDDAFTMMDGSLLLEQGSGKAETLMEVSSPTPQTIDADLIRKGSSRVPVSPRKSKTGLIVGIGAVGLILASAIVAAIVFTRPKEEKPGPEPTKTEGTAEGSPETKGDAEVKGTEGTKGKTPVGPSGEGDTKGETPVEPPTVPAGPKINITITTPGTGTYHMTGRLMVRGRCSGAEASTLTINGEKEALNEAGNFRKLITLDEGLQEIKVVAEGPENAKGETVITVVVDTTLPELRFDGIEPRKVVRTNKSPFRLSGLLDDLNPKKLTIRGSSTPLDEGRFSTDLYLDEGLNRIQVTALDKAENQTYGEVKILYDSTPPGIALGNVPVKYAHPEPRYVVQGRVDEKLRSLLLDGKEITLDGKAFTLTLGLREGANEFTLAAKDLAGNESKEALSIEYVSLLTGLAATEEEGVFVYEKDGAKMKVIPSEGILIGSDNGSPEEGPAHRVVLSHYYMDKTEVTNAQYKKFLEALEAGGDPRAFSHPDEPEGKDRIPAYWDDPDFNAPDQPVVGVDWYDAYAYAKWSGKSLPTEAEWEAAAGAGFLDKKPLYPWGDEEPKNRANFDDELGIPAKVGTYLQGATKEGLLDMAGNVQEWCLDWYAPDFYKTPEATAPNPVNRTVTKYKVLRGGHFLSAADKLKVTTRSYFFVSGRYETVGFRCVLRSKPLGE